MLSFEELAVLLSLETEYGLEKSIVAHNATVLYGGDKFDRHVALTVINNLHGRELIQGDSGFYYLTPKGIRSIKATKDGTKTLVKKLAQG